MVNSYNNNMSKNSIELSWFSEWSNNIHLTFSQPFNL